MRTTSFHFLLLLLLLLFFIPLILSVDVVSRCLNKGNASEVERERVREKERKNDVENILLLFYLLEWENTVKFELQSKTQCRNPSSDYERAFGSMYKEMNISRHDRLCFILFSMHHPSVIIFSHFIIMCNIDHLYFNSFRHLSQPTMMFFIIIIIILHSQLMRQRR